jgi:LytS/YehU family sensor histidine kinase
MKPPPHDLREGNIDQQEDSGIGVENVRKRLALHYPNRHIFVTRNSNKIYQLDLEVLL